MAQFGFFLHFYPDGHRQSWANVPTGHQGRSCSSENRRIYFPQPDWLKLRVAANLSLSHHDPANLESEPEFEAAEKFWMKYFAIVKVKTVWQDLLTHLDEEEFLGFQFFQYPSDYFTLEVLDVYALKTPFRAPEAVSQGYIISSLLTKPNDLYCQPDFDVMSLEVSKITTAAGRARGSQRVISIRSVLQKAGVDLPSWSPMSLPVPHVLYRLLSRLQWSIIPSLGRWRNLLKRLPPDIQSKMGLEGYQPPDRQQGQLTIAKLRTLMMQLQSWAPRVLQTCDGDEEQRIDLQFQLHSAIRWLLNVMANFPESGRAVVHDKRIYSSVFLVRSMLATRLIPAYVCMKSVCSEVIGSLFPNLLDKPLQDLLASKHVFPSDSGKHMIRLFLDCALLFWRRGEEEQCDFVRFGGADSSPQHGYNWLLSTHFFVDKKHIVHVFRCLQRMIADSCERASSGVIYDEEASAQSKQDHLDVLSMLRREHDLPVALGNQAESTAHKCAAMLHKFVMRISVGNRYSNLRKFTSSFFSFCSDMGVEIGIGDFRLDRDSDLKGLLPDWLMGPDLASDLPMDACSYSAASAGAAAASASVSANISGGLYELESDVGAPPHSPSDSQCQAMVPSDASSGADRVEGHRVDDDTVDGDAFSSLFLPKALRIPGSLHKINNALEQVTESLSHWTDFLVQLKLFESLWCHGRLQRFVNFCLRSSELSHRCDDVLKQKLGSLYTKRWGEVVHFCIRLKNVLPIIRSAWDERRYNFGLAADNSERQTAAGDAGNAGGDSNHHSSFDPNLLTQTLRDSFFFAYLDMVLALVSMTEDIAFWAESCSCHEDILSHSHKRSMSASKNMKSSRVLSNFFSGKADVCPMRGKRLPELVAYGADKMLLDLGSAAIGSLFVSHRHFVSIEQWNQLRSDFDVGKNQAVLQFRLKFDWANRLPYKLALLAFRDQALARRELGRIASEFDAQPEELKKNHHFVTLQILRPGSILRGQFDAWLSGVPLNDPRLHDLEFQAGCFRLVQITERLYEASHSILKRRTPPNASGPLISLQCRLLDVATEIKVRPETLLSIASQYDVARDYKKLPYQLGLERHPWVFNSIGKKWKLIRALNKVLYRADPIGQFPDVSHLDAWHQKVRKKIKQKAKDMMNKASARKSLQLTYENLRACALQQHFLAVADSSSEVVFSLPDCHASGLLQQFNQVLAMTVPHDVSLDADIEMGVVPEPQFNRPSSSSGSIIFRVVSTNPSSRRLLSLDLAPAGIGGQLQSDDVAICLLSEGPACHDSGKAWLSAPSSKVQDSVVQILRHLPQRMSFAEMTSSLLVHHPCSDGLQYSLPSSVGDRNLLADSVSFLVESAAFPGSSIFVHLEMSEVTHSLLSQDFIVGDINQRESYHSYQLTQRGVDSLLMFRLYGSPTRVNQFVLTDSDPTLHMMLQELEDQGWQWQPLCAPKKRKPEDEAYIIGHEKIWKTISLNVQRLYVQCLLEAEHLQSRFRIQSIPHGSSAEVYTALLKGEQPAKKKARVQFELEDDLHQPQPLENVIALEVEEFASANQIRDFDFGDDAGSESVNRIIHLLEEADVKTVDSSNIAPDSLAHDPVNDAQDESKRLTDVELEGLDRQSAADADPRPVADSGSALAAPPVPSKGSESDHHDQSRPHANRRIVSMPVDDPTHGNFDWKTFKWGAFTFTSKRPTKTESGTQGTYVWQAACPFHAKNDKSGCRKSCNISPLTEENYSNVINCLKAWCNEAKKCKTQADHIALTASPTSFPAPSLIESACIPASEKPTSKVKTDVEILQAAHVPADSMPKQKAKSKAKAKPKGKVASKAKAKAEAANPSASSDSSSSSESGSGSLSDSSSSSSSQDSGSSSSSS